MQRRNGRLAGHRLRPDEREPEIAVPHSGPCPVEGCENLTYYGKPGCVDHMPYAQEIMRRLHGEDRDSA